MQRDLLWRLCALALTLSPAPLVAETAKAVVLESARPESKTEISNNSAQKIIVKGENAQLRMAVATIANEVAIDLHRLLNDGEEYAGSRNVFITLYEKQGKQGRMQIRPRVTPIENEDLVIELLVNAGASIDHTMLSRGILEILLYRRGLEEVKTLGYTQQAQLPMWLSYGIVEALEWKKDDGNRRLYEHLLTNPELFPLSKVLDSSGYQVAQFDATNQAFYKAASSALVLSLLRQDAGEKAMQDFLSEVVLYEGEMDLLIRKHFPSMAEGANAMQKVWSLQLAEMSAPKMVETLSLAESDKRLSELLVLSISDEEGNARLEPLENYAQLAGLAKPERILATDALRQGVMHLSNRCHPIYKPILLEYVRLADEVAQGNETNIAVRLPILADERQKIVIADERCRDYLDWYQITRAYEVTGDFSGYMQLKERLAMEREERKDEVIDPYLDKVQELMKQRRR